MQKDVHWTGNLHEQSWNSRTNPTDFFQLKTFVEMVFARLGLDGDELMTGESSRSYYSESLSYLAGNKVLAETGKLSKSCLNGFDIKQDVYYAHIDWDFLVNTIKNHTISYKELPKYPWVRRDLALLIDRGVKFSRIRELAFKAEKNILREVNLFDVYESDSLGNNKKSYAVSFILQDELKTLTDKNIEKVMNNLIRIYTQELNAQIR